MNQQKQPSLLDDQHEQQVSAYEDKSMVASGIANVVDTFLLELVVYVK